MKSLNLQLRFLVPLLVTLVAAAYLALPLMDRLTLRWFSRDLNMRGTLVTNALSDSIARRDAAIAQGARLQTLFDRAVQDERLFAIGLCSLDGTMLRSTRQLSADLDCQRGARPPPSSPNRGFARRRAGPRRRAPGQRRDRHRSPSWCCCTT